jgi:hypothetical protein
MNPVHRLSISFGVILILGGLIFSHQNRRLEDLAHRAEFRSAAASPPITPLNETPEADSSDTTPAVESSQPRTDPADAFISKLKEALAASLAKDQVRAFLNMGGKGLSFESLAAAANPTNVERDTIRQGLERYDEQKVALYLNRDLASTALTAGLAEVKRRQDEWLAAQLGKERYEAILRSNEQHTRASAERRAAGSVSRINSAADLTETQKEKLYAGFLELNLHPPTAAEDKLVVDTFGYLEIGPSAPDLSEDAEKILTPEQRQLYQLQQQAAAQNTAAQGAAMMSMMESLMPVVMGLLESDP